eukprot:SAG31_NODE_3799_length_3870_cov_4.446036_5_plen_30_part_01
MQLEKELGDKVNDPTALVSLAMKAKEQLKD